MYEYRAKVLRVVDGDTLDLLVDLGMSVHVKERCRLLGVNTPETYGVKKNSEEYAKGLESKKWLIRQIVPRMEDEAVDDIAEGRGIYFLADEMPMVRIITTKDKKGKYGRYLVTLYVGDDLESINTKIIHQGYGATY